jgi:hypothetical protein
MAGDECKGKKSISKNNSFSIFIQPQLTSFTGLFTFFTPLFTAIPWFILNLIYFLALSNSISTHPVRKDFGLFFWPGAADYNMGFKGFSLVKFC